MVLLVEPVRLAGRHGDGVHALAVLRIALLLRQEVAAGAAIAGLPALAPTTVANLTSPLLEAVAAGLRPGNLPGKLVCSGLLATEFDRVIAAFEPHGLVEAGRGRIGDWGSLTLAGAPHDAGEGE